MAIHIDSISLVVFIITIISIICNVVSVVLKLCKDFTNPKLWKYSLLYQDVAYLCLSVGLLLFCVNLYVDVKIVCDVAGFFLLFGILECLLSYITTGIILLSIQNPGKSSHLSGFHRNVCIVIVTPEIILGATLSVLPYMSDRLFNTHIEFEVVCFPIRDHGKQGSAYGTLLLVLWWLILIGVIVSDVIIVLKLWKFNNRINSAQNNVWQDQLIEQGKALVKITVIEHIVSFISVLTITLTLYLDTDIVKTNSTWLVMTSLALSAIIHGFLSNVGDVMWTSCCCRDTSVVKEPHKKLNKLELIKIEAPGKLRMKATWTVGKHATKRGLMKVYGLSHLKCWAQEIVMLGMLRRIQHPSLIQCLWTNSSNPYYETMTLISGEIITSDSRIICLELTNGGTLHDFLQKLELPLPEQCQRMIIHDIAEGLFYLHHENIMHNNLTSSCIYLKGSLQTKMHKTRVKSMVLRAAVGDFEEANIYGALQQSLDSSIKDKRYFFLPDIRSFALIALEVVSKMCEKKFQNRYVNFSEEHVPLKLNLTNDISDEDDEFEAQYCYEAEDTHRMFEAIHDDEEFDSEYNEENVEIRQGGSGSLANLMDQSRPMSPMYSGRDARTPDTMFNNEDSDNDNKQLANYGSPYNSNTNWAKESMQSTDVGINTSRCKSPEMPKSDTGIGKISSRKIRKDTRRQTNGKCDSSPNFVSQNLCSSHNPLERTLINDRCASPDPMKDSKLQELRKETTSSVKQSKKERKPSFNSKKSDKDISQKGNMEAFVRPGAEQNGKRKDGNWLAKPGSILKSIASDDTTISVFKAKNTGEDSHLDAIEEEDISPGQSSFPKSRQVKVKEAKAHKAEVWDIIDEQYYTQVNKKAINNLKKTVSGESRSSLWSFISSPEDLDDDDLGDILECLPGMTDPIAFRKPDIAVSDIIAEREKAIRKEQTKKKFNFTQLSKSKFELIDYYELLIAKQITLNDVPEDKRQMLLNVVELKREEKMKRQGIIVNSVIRSDEMYSNNMSPGGEYNNSNPKVKMVSFRNTQCHSSPHKNGHAEQQRDPRLDRARSAPLKRPRTPMHKQTVGKSPEVNPAFNDTKSLTIAKRNRARAALKRALNSKGQQAFPRTGPERERTSDITVKYATVRTINADINDKSENGNDKEVGELVTVPVPTSESFSITNVKPQPQSYAIKRSPSFSSNESASTSSSIGSSVRQRRTDVSLTSGEFSSLSSQAESDHYETDYPMTDVETGRKKPQVRRSIMTKTHPLRVDSGFDSGSVSSEMSDPLMNKTIQLNTQFHHVSNKGIVDSWARNYKMINSVSNSPYTFGNKLLPPVDSLPEETLSTENNHLNIGIMDTTKSSINGTNSTDNNSGVNITQPILVTNPRIKTSRIKDRHTRSRERIQSQRQKELQVNFTPYTTVSSRPESLHSRSQSPPSRVMSPVNRAASPPGRSMSPALTRPFSPEVQGNSVKTKSVQPKIRSMSPNAKLMSPNRGPMSPNTRPMPPNTRPMSSNTRPMSRNTRLTSPNTRPLSADSRSMSPNTRSMSPNARPMSPITRPMSPDIRPMSPNVRPTNNRAVTISRLHPTRQMSPRSRALSPTREISQNAKPPGPFLPGRKLNRPPSPPPRQETYPVQETNLDSSQLSDTASVAESSASVASKRYRELVKQGVPLRTSVIDASPTRLGGSYEDVQVRPITADSMIEEPPNDQELFENLDANGFFATTSRSRSPSPHKLHGRSPANSNEREHKGDARRKKKKHIPLEELVRETPVSNFKERPHRSPSKNHLTVTDEALLNQPTSEDSETCSIKTNKSNTSTPSGSKPKMMVDAELVIDRIFSQNQHEDNELDVEVEAALGLNKDPFKAIREMYLNNERPETSNLDEIPLLNGVSQKHIHECMELASSLHVLTIRDLLPATRDSFEVLRNKLQQIGQLGTVGNQDMPPSSCDLVEQLTDPVTETEV